MYCPAKPRNVTVLSGDSPVSDKWDESKLQTYQQNLRSNVCQSINNLLLSDIIDNNLDCDEISDDLYNMLNTAINGTFKVKGKTNINPKFPTNKCKILKTHVKSYANNHDISVPPHSEIHHGLEQEYNRTIQKCKWQYNDSIRLQLKNFHSDGPDAYWKLWKSLCSHPINNNNLTLSQFDMYCKEQVNAPPTAYFDEVHMQEIELFVNFSSEGLDEENICDNLALSDEICNSPISIEEIQTHVQK